MRSHAPITATAALLLLALTGCTSTPATTAGESTAPQTSAPSSPSPTPTVAPLVAETPAAQTGPDAEAAFLTNVRERISKIRTQIPNATDQQLLEAAATACTRLEQGESGESMSLIDGETQTNGYFMDSGAIVTAARMTLCPVH